MARRNCRDRHPNWELLYYLTAVQVRRLQAYIECQPGPPSVSSGPQAPVLGLFMEAVMVMCMQVDHDTHCWRDGGAGLWWPCDSHKHEPHVHGIDPSLMDYVTYT